MRRKCDECGVFGVTDDEGLCSDCRQELVDEEDFDFEDDEECEYGHPQCAGDCEGEADEDLN